MIFLYGSSEIIEIMNRCAELKMLSKELRNIEENRRSKMSKRLGDHENMNAHVNMPDHGRQAFSIQLLDADNADSAEASGIGGEIASEDIEGKYEEFGDSGEAASVNVRR